MNVLVYSGEGTSRTSLAHTVRTLKALVGHQYDVMKIDSHGLLTEPWEESTSLLVIPGGRDIPYTKFLNGPPNDRIRAYVQAGGRFWGICAGAYFSSSHVVFEPETPLGVEGPRELKFFAGECRGVVYPGFVYDSEQGASAVEIQLNGDLSKDPLGYNRTTVYFNGGGYFVNAETFPDTEVLAWYTDNNGPESVSPHGSTGAKAAMIACKVGQGLALLTGVHPEYDASHLDAGNPEYGPLPNVVSRLLEQDKERVLLLRSLLTKLGLKLNQQEPQASLTNTGSDIELPPGAIQGIPDLTSLYLASTRPAITQELTRSLKSLVAGAGLIKEANDTFQLIDSPQHAAPFHTPTLSEDADGEGEEKVIKNIVLCPEGAPPANLTPQFTMDTFFNHLQQLRSASFNGGQLRFGDSLLYGQVVTSTQTMLDKNFVLCQKLPNGFVCNATTQVAGRGRGRNSWISAPGCLQFSMVLRHPVQARHASAVFVQYLVALAVVEAVCSMPGYEEVPMKLKWPNDIYAEAPVDDGSERRMIKIGGVLVNSNFSGNEFLLVIGKVPFFVIEQCYELFISAERNI